MLLVGEQQRRHITCISPPIYPDLFPARITIPGDPEKRDMYKQDDDLLASKCSAICEL